MSESVKQSVVGSVPMRVNVQGRVVRSRRHEGHFYTAIVTPAPDAYSRPSNVEVRSKSQLGTSGEDVNLWCVLGGYSERPRKWTDTETGEVRTIYNVRMYLDLVE